MIETDVYLQLSISTGQSWRSSGKYLRFMGHEAVIVILICIQRNDSKKIKNQKRFFPFFVWFGRDCTGVIYWRTWKPLLIRWSLVCWSYVWVLNVWLTRTRHIQPRVDSGANICILDYLHSGQNRAGWDVASSISWRFLASCRLWVARHTAAPFWISSGESFWESIKPAGWIKHCTSATEMLLKRWHILRSVKGSVLISILISDTR